MSLFLEKNLVATGRCSGLASAQIAHLHTRQLSRSQRQPDSRPLRACAARSVASHKLVVHASGNGASTSSRGMQLRRQTGDTEIISHGPDRALTLTLLLSGPCMPSLLTVR